jgi:hypothetical protein
VKLSEAKSDLKPLPVVFDSGAVLNITYRVPEYTPYELAKVVDKSDPDPTRIIGMILKVVESWDLTDDDGQDIPLTVDGVGENVGIGILRKIMDAIGKDQMPGEAGETSAAG